MLKGVTLFDFIKGLLDTSRIFNYMKLEMFFKPNYHAFHTRYAVLFRVPASCPSLMECNCILDLHTTSHYLLIEDVVTMRNESKFPNFPTRTSLTQCMKAAHSRALATTAHSHLSTNTLQSYRNVSLYALLLKSPSQC